MCINRKLLLQFIKKNNKKSKKLNSAHEAHLQRIRSYTRNVVRKAFEALPSFRVST